MDLEKIVDLINVRNNAGYGRWDTRPVTVEALRANRGDISALIEGDIPAGEHFLRRAFEEAGAVADYWTHCGSVGDEELVSFTVKV